MTQEKQIPDRPGLSELAAIPAGRRIIALDPGTKRIGVATSDETQALSRALPRIERTAWKKVLLAVKELVREFDAAAVVIGLPFNFDGSDSEMTAEARRIARNLELSLDVPVFLQDERASSYEAKGRLWQLGAGLDETRKLVDSEAAAVILGDFLDRLAEARKTS